MKLASATQRFLAWAIDFQLNWLLVGGYLFLSSVNFVNVDDLVGMSVVGLTIFLWLAIISSPYYAYFTSRFGGTIGKLVLGIQVVDESRKNHLTFWMSYFRSTIGYMVSNMLFGLGFYWIIRDPNRQAWHDKLVGSFVVTKPAKSPAQTIVGLLLVLAVFIVNLFFFLALIANVVSNQSLQADWNARFGQSTAPMIKSP